MKPTVLLDCDGVLADFYRAAFDVIEDLTGVRHDISELRSWEIFQSIGDRDLGDRTYNAMNEPGFCLERVHPLPGAVEGIARIRERCDLFILTAPFRSGFWLHERLAWLETHMGIPRDSVVFARQKRLVRGDLFVDDNPHHVRSWDRNRRACTGEGFVWDQPYNRLEMTKLNRMHGWDELDAWIDNWKS